MESDIDRESVKAASLEQELGGLPNSESVDAKADSLQIYSKSRRVYSVENAHHSDLTDVLLFFLQ